MNELAYELKRARKEAGIDSMSLSLMIGRNRNFISRIELEKQISIEDDIAIHLEEILNIEDQKLRLLATKYRKNRQRKGRKPDKEERFDLHFIVKKDCRDKVDSLSKNYSTKCKWFRIIIDELSDEKSPVKHLMTKVLEEKKVAEKIMRRERKTEWERNRRQKEKEKKAMRVKEYKDDGGVWKPINGSWEKSYKDDGKKWKLINGSWQKV